MKRTVAIYGFSEHTRHHIQDSQATAVWTLNNAYDYDAPMERITRWYEFHLDAWELLNDAHRAFLKGMQPFLIYSKEKRADMPCSAVYPLDAICADIGVRYFTNTIAMMIAHAIFEKFDRIEIYGVDMEGGTEYAYQKAGTEFMIGIAMGRGIDVYLPPHCALLNAAVYGYDAHSEHISIDTIRAHRDAYQAKLTELQADYAPLVSAYQAHLERYKESDAELAQQINARNPDIWLYNGAVAWLDGMLEGYTKAGTVSRQVVERSRIQMVGMLSAANDQMNQHNGYLSAQFDTERPQAEIAPVVARRDELVKLMHEHDGALGALNKLKRHIDFIPYDLELAHSVQ